MNVLVCDIDMNIISMYIYNNIKCTDKFIFF